MPDEPQPSVHQLAERLADGFAALSGEYQTLFDQQRQLESKLSWAKQQVSTLVFFQHPTFSVMKNLSSRPAVVFRL